MSQFDYMSQGELNSKYLLELTTDYLEKLSKTNDTNGIADDDYKINPNANRFAKWFKNLFRQIGFKFNKKASLENYSKVLSTKYIQAILDKISIYLKTDVLEAKKFFELTSTLNAIKFNDVVPALEEYRHRAIKSSQRKLSKAIQDAKYLKYARSNYILYNSPVEDLKPFLSKEVSEHTIDYTQIQQVIKQYINVRYAELTQAEFESYEPEFKTDINEFYNEKITDNGVGEEVESFIRSKMLEKLEIAKHEDRLIEDINNDIMQIDLLLKRLKVGKIEEMIQQLIKLKYDLSRVKEVVDLCKETVNGTTIPNKAQIFLIMDNLYYGLSKKCETLEQKTKAKLQVVDKQKLFSMLDMIQNPHPKPSKKSKRVKQVTDNSFKDEFDEDGEKPDITSNLYDEDDKESEIDISEDGGSDNSDDEIIID